VVVVVKYDKSGKLVVYAFKLRNKTIVPFKAGIKIGESGILLVRSGRLAIAESLKAGFP
jgi:hypothetical protein